MPAVNEWIQSITNGEMKSEFESLYGQQNSLFYAQTERYSGLLSAFSDYFGDGDIRLFCAPGRTELCGNHTDHNHGRILASSVNLDIIGAVRKTDTNIIRVKSVGFHKTDIINLDTLTPVEEEREHSASLIRGIASRMKSLGFQIGGFDAYTTSSVLRGSGLSSSAAFEILMVTILNFLYNNGTIDPVTASKIAQYAENHFYGKPCGLMDQMACAVGGCIAIDFKNPDQPVVEPVKLSLSDFSHTLCIVVTGDNHSNLTPEYAAIVHEMKLVASWLGKETLREVAESQFYDALGEIRFACGDRAVLRAIHYFEENRRVCMEKQAIENGDFSRFLELCVASGRSSYMLLQNAYVPNAPGEQGLALALAVSERILSGNGAWRVHGGGFAGTIQAIVPDPLVQEYRETIEKVTGKGTCHIVGSRLAGGIELPFVRSYI